MKQKKTQRGNQPYYSQYLTKTAPPAAPKGAASTRKRSDSPGDRVNPDLRSEKKPYGGKPTDKPREKRNFQNQPNTLFTKPTGYKSSFKSKEKPADKPRSFDKPFDNRESRPERKPYGDKPFENRESRPERKPYGDKPFENRESRPERKPYGDKPFEKRESRPERKQYGEKPFENRESRPERKPYGDKPFDNRESPERKPYGEKVREENPDKKRDGGESRRVGDFKEAPRYNLERAVERLPDKKKPVIEKHEETDLIRLNRFIANAGVCSRREADELISMGQISVNGQVITELGHKVQRNDVVKYAGRLLNAEKLVYILVNKPKDYITTTEDPEDRHTVMELIAGACSERVYPVGRLDRNTTGLLLFTNDGELAEKLMHPSNGVQKIYQVELDKPITTEDFDAIKAGFDLEDGFVKADEVGIVTPDAMVVGIEIHSGRNRIVRRIFEHLGYDVLKLDRTAYAGLNKKELPRGKWRFLNEREVVRLKYLL